MSLSCMPMVTVFEAGRSVVSGGLLEVAAELKSRLGAQRQSSASVFSDETGRVVDIDFSGSVEEVLARLRQRFPATSLTPEVPPANSGPGRPRLGVVAREVTLLPRHWEWLNSQPGGASAALRRLVDNARRESEGADRQRRSREATYAFVSATAGNEPGFEEAVRALFNGSSVAFSALMKGWPEDIKTHALRLAEASWPDPGLDTQPT